MRLFDAIGKFFRNLFNIQAHKINKAADDLYDGVEGIEAAFTEYGDNLKDQYQSMEKAVGQQQMIIEQKRQRLEKMNEEEEKLIKRRRGALVKAQEAKAAGDTKTVDDMRAAYADYDAKINKIEADQARIEQEVKQATVAMEEHMRMLRKLHRKIQELPQDQADAIADRIGAQSTLEFNRRMQGLTKSTDRSGIDAVLAKNRELTAQAKVSQVMAGADSEAQDEELEALGTGSDSDFDAMLVAMEAEEAAKTGEKVKDEGQADGAERPEI